MSENHATAEKTTDTQQGSEAAAQEPAPLPTQPGQTDPATDQSPPPVSTDPTQPGPPEPPNPPAGPDTFPRSYVERLRRESAGYRERANRADELAVRLHTELVKATGRLADASDLAFDAAHLDDAEALATAIDELVARKPHLASRRPMGDVGQGATVSNAPVDLAGMMRARA